MQNINDEIEAAPVGSLVKHPDNPREGDIEAIRESIRENGFFGAIIAQRSTRRVLAGNHTLEAARREGAEHVPVIFVDVDDERAKKILLADNRTSDLAEYDVPDLEAALEEVDFDVPGFDESDFNDPWDGWDSTDDDDDSGLGDEFDLDDMVSGDDDEHDGPTDDDVGGSDVYTFRVQAMCDGPDERDELTEFLDNRGYVYDIERTE